MAYNELENKFNLTVPHIDVSLESGVPYYIIFGLTERTMQAINEEDDPQGIANEMKAAVCAQLENVGVIVSNVTLVGVAPENTGILQAIRTHHTPLEEAA